MIEMAARPLAVVAALGWVFTLVASVAGIVGFDLAPWLTGAAFVGMFPLWLFAILYMNRLTKGARNQDLWKAAFRGCPDWLRYAIWASWGYSFLMFALMAGAQNNAGMVGFVGVFYASSLGVFVTAAAVGAEPLQCSNGHELGPFDKFCAECGSPRPEAVR